MNTTRPARSRASWVAVTSLGVALGAMAVDHLLGTEREQDESGLVDPTMFTVSALLSLAAAVLLFGWLVPRARSRGVERAATTGIACSALSVFPGIAFLWVGFPFVVAGAGVELGLAGRHGDRRRLALAAVGLGSALLVAGTVGYAYAAAVELAGS